MTECRALSGCSTFNRDTLIYNADKQATALAPLSGGTSNTVSYLDQGNNLRASVAGDSFDNGPLGVTALTTSAGTTYYTRDPQGDLIDARGPAGTSYFVTDRQNSVRMLTNSAGTDAGDYTYDAYGTLTNTGTLTATATANPWRYTSGYQDIEGDNDYHLGARYYDPTIARFTQPDSVIGNLANPSTVNLYAYTGADPINNTDPTGHDFLGDLAGAAAGLVGGIVGGVIGLGIAGPVGAAVGAGLVGGALGAATSQTDAGDSPDVGGDILLGVTAAVAGAAFA